MIIKRKVKKNQVHVVRQVDNPTRTFSEGERYNYIPWIIPRYGMMVLVYTLEKEFSEIPISEPKYY